jgi:predicted permease
MASFFSYAEYRAYRDRNHSLSGLAAYQPFVTAALGGTEPRQVVGALTSCNYFDVLGIRPAAGRTFSVGECGAADSAAVAVLSDDLWRTAFGADPAIVGRTVSLNRARFVVIGIGPRGFVGTEAVAAAFWAPLTMQRVVLPAREFLNDDHLSWLVLLGRLAPGAGLGRARADLAIIASQIDGLEPGRTTRLDVRVATILPQPEERMFVLGVGAIVLAAVSLVLLVACANVANLQLARAAGRRREMAVRLAIGAGRWRLVRQLLIESLIVAGVGGAVGTLVALWASAALVNAVLAHLPAGVPQIVVPVGPDFRVLAYSAVMTALTGIAFGLVPALGASRVDLVPALKQDEGARPDGHGPRARLWRHGLVGMQVAVSMVLLLSAGLLARGLAHTYEVDPGFDASNAAVMSFDLEGGGYDEPRAAGLNRRLLERLMALPAVDRVSLARTTPLSDQHVEAVFSIPGESSPRQIELNYVSPAYFDMFRIPIVRGRNFSEAEQQHDAHVVIVTEAAARRLWPGANPLDKTLDSGDGGASGVYRVIGVTRDAGVSRLGEQSPVYIYLSAGSGPQVRMNVLAHFRGRFSPVASAMRAAARALDPDLPIQVSEVHDNLEVWRMPARVAVVASGCLGALALVLAAIGLYGVVAYTVSRRIREIGVRMALGADGRDVMMLIVGQTARPVVLGGVAGLVGAAGAAQVLSKLLFGVSPLDPLAFVAVPAFLLVVALAAAYVPARRAMRVDPIAALRCE